VNEDDVTKFALRTKTISDILNNTVMNDYDHVYASLANHPDVQKRINTIRSKFDNWEVEIPNLLKTLGTRTLLKKYKKINQDANEKLEPKVKSETSQEESKGWEVSSTKSSSTKNALKRTIHTESDDSSSEDELPDIPKNAERVDDLFFVSKKVNLPKLLSEEIPSKEPKNITREDAFTKINRPKVDRARERFPSEKEREKKIHKSWGNRPDPQWSKNADPVSYEEKAEEQLHPSWAAKRIQKQIQPFQGKKIKFSDD